MYTAKHFYVDVDFDKYTSGAEQQYNQTDIALPDGLETVKKYQFVSFDDILTVKIPKSVTKIEDLAFYACFKITDVYYTGTQAEWENIEGHDELEGANITMHFNFVPAV